jgi:hypothetical protein
MTRKADDQNVKVRVTKLGAGRVSTGAHVAVSGEVMAGAGDMLTVPREVAEALEAQGLAEIE